MKNLALYGVTVLFSFFSSSSIFLPSILPLGTRKPSCRPRGRIASKGGNAVERKGKEKEKKEKETGNVDARGTKQDRTADFRIWCARLQSRTLPLSYRSEGWRDGKCLGIMYMATWVALRRRCRASIVRWCHSFCSSLFDKTPLLWLGRSRLFPR